MSKHVLNTEAPLLGVTINHKNLGELYLSANSSGVCSLSFTPDYSVPMLSSNSFSLRKPPLNGEQAAYDIVRTASDLIHRYFNGDIRAIDNIPVAPRGTSFQLRVWAALRLVKPGTTVSYGELANAIGNPAGVRAVGQALGKNPIVLIIPCHRVIGGNGTLTGFSAGLERKRWLLEHEGVAVEAEEPDQHMHQLRLVAN